MDTRKPSSGEGDVASPVGDPGVFEVPSLPEGVGMQPQLDSIFAEVQASLPSIDFDVSDVSDVSSDEEEIAIVSRSLRTPTPLENDPRREGDMSTETWRSALDFAAVRNALCHVALYPAHADSQASSRKTSDSSTSSAAELMALDPSIVQVGAAHSPLSDGGSPREDPVEMSRGDAQIHSWSDLLYTMGLRDNVFPSQLTSTSNVIPYGMTQAADNRNAPSGPDPVADTGSPAEEGSPSTDLAKSRISSMIPTRVPKLSMRDVEGIDLDQLLVSFPAAASGAPVGNSRPTGHPQTGGGDGTHRADGESLSLMEKLAQLCVQQSSGTLSKTQLLGTPAPVRPESARIRPAGIGRDTGVPRDGPPGASGRTVAWAAEGGATKQNHQMREVGTNTTMDDPVYKPKSTASIGVSAQIQPPMERSTNSIGIGTGSVKKERTETVFLDLRETTAAKTEEEPQVVPEAVKRILKLNLSGGSESCGSESSEDDEEDLQAWRANRKRGLKGSSPPPAKAKKGVSSRAAPPPRVIMPTTDKATAPTASHAQLPQDEKAIAASPPTISVKTLSPSGETLFEALPATPPPSPTAATSATDETQRRERLLQEETRRKLREHREQERAAKARLQKRLEALRPRLSASGKRPAAEATPIIYDMEASYTASPHCLPPILRPVHECALLTIRLSTSGEIIPQRCPASSRSPSERCICVTYQLLLSWLLSLVPPSFDYLVDGFQVEKVPKPEVYPFWVVGLQQVYQDGGLVVNVAVTPTTFADGKQHLLKRKTKGLGKEGTRDSTLFQSHLSTFLTINTLLTVCPWVETTFSCAIRRSGAISDSRDQATHDTVLEDGSYVPSLPDISSKPLSMLLTVSQDRASVAKVFGSGEAAFFWQTIDSDEAISEQTSSEEYDSHSDAQNTMSLVYKSVYRNPTHMMGFFYRVLQEGLDIAGMRLLYHSEKISAADQRRESGSRPLLDHMNKVGPILAIAVRGAMARTRWLDAIGPSDPQLARRTDPQSLIALFGGQTREEVPIYCPRNPNRVSHELALWFGGRVPESGVVDVGYSAATNSQQRQEKRGRRGKRGSQSDSGGWAKDSLEVTRKPPVMLVATTQSHVFLVVSPIVPPNCMGSVLSACQTRGYQLRGIRRLRLNNKRVAALGLMGAQVRAFNPLSCTTPTSPAQKYEQKLRRQLEAEFPAASPSPMPSLVVLLRKENALHHAAGLMEATMVFLCMRGMLTTIKENSPTGTLATNLCFHAVPYTESLLAQLGGDLTSLPSGGGGGSSSGGLLHSACPAGGFYTNPELEQVVVVTFAGADALKTFGSTLNRLLGLYPFNPSNQPPPSPSAAVGQGLELLGIKWTAALTAAQAKELTPYEVGHRYWQPSVRALASGPALVCAVRGLNALQLVHSVLGTSPVTGALPGKGIANLERIVSLSAGAAFRQATLFFRDQELFADPSMRVNLPYLPPLRSPSLEELSTARFAWAEPEAGDPAGGTTTTPPPTGGASAKGRKWKGKGGARTQQQGKGTLVVEESIYKAMLVGPRLLTTVAVIKPLAVRKHLSKILKRIAQQNFTVVGLKLTVISDDEARELVPKDDKEDEMLCAMHAEHLTSGPVLLLCLQRENAVRKLLDLLGPANPQDARRQSQFLWRGMYGADPINNGIHGSESYQSAVDEQKLLFPDGLCCRETPDLQADKILCRARDAVMGYQQASRRRFVARKIPVKTESNDSLLSPVTSTHSLSSVGSGTSASSADLLLAPRSALCQTNCLLLTPPLLLTRAKGYYRGHIEVVDALLARGFDVAGMRMVWLGEDQAREYSGVYARAFPSLPKILCHGPSIVVAVQRDNAVSCFDALLGSCFDKESVISKYGEHILRPKDPKEASRHLEFFFDELVPRSQGEIVPC